MQDLEDTIAEPFRTTPGFIAFVGAMFLPVVLAIVIYLGAWAVSDDVYAAEARAREPGAANNLTSDDAAGWKKTLVGICPVH